MHRPSHRLGECDALHGAHIRRRAVRSEMYVSAEQSGGLDMFGHYRMLAEQLVKFFTGVVLRRALRSLSKLPPLYPTKGARSFHF